MNNQHEVYGEDDATLMDVPISFITPQKSKIDDLKNMDKQHNVDSRDAIMAVPISWITPQADVLAIMNNQHKVYGDDDDTLKDMPRSFITPQKSKVDDLKNMDKQHKVDGRDAIMAVPISWIAPQADVLAHKVYDDDDATLKDMPRSFITTQKSKVDDLKNMDKQHKIDGRDAIMAVPISWIAPEADVLMYKVDSDEDATLMEVPISFFTPQESKVNVIEKQHTIDDTEDAILMEVPISFITPDESKVDVLKNMDKLHQADGDEDALLMEVPISFIALEESKVDVLENEMIPKNMHYMHTHTFEQRRQNWIIKNSSRRDGLTIDYVYHHLDTNKKFRSMIEVYKFVVYGEVREKKKKLSENEETLQVTPRRKSHMRGNKLIKHYVVGTCTKSCYGIYIKNRGEINYLSERDIPSNIEKKRKRENEDLYGHQQVNLRHNATCVNSRDATLSTPVQSFFYLWDFELIHPQKKTAEVFPISDIKESKREEPFIDLLRELAPKALGKLPLEEDKERNKSKKRKDRKRDQEKEDILEAQKRSKVDEDLRLDELRARAVGASSSIVPAQVGLISGVDVAIESQTLTIASPSIEGTSKALLTVSSTTDSAIDVFGDIEAPALFLN